MSDTPSDEEILVLAQQHLKAFAQFRLGEVWFEGEVEFARAVLAKWGQQAQAVEPVADGLPLVITGAIYDFAGFLTTRQKVIEVGSTANASPIADLVQEWAAKRNLSLENAAVLSWQDRLAAPQPVVREPLSDDVVQDAAFEAVRKQGANHD